MITINELFARVTIHEEAKPVIQTTGHMTHVGDWSIYGEPTHGLEHMNAMANWFKGKSTPNHSVSLKADGGVSVLVGRKNDGTHFISYKSGKKHFSTPEEIDAAGVPWGEDGKKILAKVKEMNIKPGTAFQGDMLWVDRNELENSVARPNTIRYKPTEHEMGIAVHSQYKVSDTGDFHKVSSTPDIKQLQHPDVHVPDLQLKAGSVKLGKERTKAVDVALKAAKAALTPEVQKYAKDVSGNKNIHKFLQEYLNEIVATSGDRSIESLRKYINEPLTKLQTSKAYMEKASQKNLSDKRKQALHAELHRHINENEAALAGLLHHHQQLSIAKHHMLDALREHQHKHSIQPAEGEEHEGLVSAFGKAGTNETLAKLTREGPQGFSSRNRARGVERGFYGPVQEEGEGGGMMTASSGDIAGMGYNLGKEGPDDLVIRTPDKRKTLPTRRKIVRKILSSMNVGREAY